MEQIKIEGNEDWYWNTTFSGNSSEKLNYVACSPECAKKISQKFIQNHENYQINREKEGEKIREAYDKAHEKAQKYWNSLSEEQKRQKIKEIEKKIIKEKNKNGSLEIYIEGNLRYDYYWKWTKENPNFSSPNINQVPISLVEEFMEENSDSQNQDGTGNFQDFNPIHNSQSEREREREREPAPPIDSFNFQQSETDNDKNSPSLETPVQEPKENTLPINNNNNENENEDQLSRTKNQVIKEIETYLNELDQINLKILAEGKYQNWKKDIEKLVSEEAIIQYKNSFFRSLNEFKLNNDKANAISQNHNNKNGKIFFGFICGGLILMIWYWHRRRNT